MQDNECIKYLKAEFPEDLIQLIAHDKAAFDRPKKWKDSEVLSSPLFINFNSVWNKVSGIYNSEVGALSYGTIPTADDIFNSIALLLEEIKRILQ